MKNDSLLSGTCVATLFLVTTCACTVNVRADDVRVTGLIEYSGFGHEQLIDFLTTLSERAGVGQRTVGGLRRMLSEPYVAFEDQQSPHRGILSVWKAPSGRMERVRFMRIRNGEKLIAELIKEAADAGRVEKGELKGPGRILRSVFPEDALEDSSPLFSRYYRVSHSYLFYGISEAVWEDEVVEAIKSPPPTLSLKGWMEMSRLPRTIREALFEQTTAPLQVQLQPRDQAGQNPGPARRLALEAQLEYSRVLLIDGARAELDSHWDETRQQIIADAALTGWSKQNIVSDLVIRHPRLRHLVSDRQPAALWCGIRIDDRLRKFVQRLMGEAGDDDSTLLQNLRSLMLSDGIEMVWRLEDTAEDPGETVFVYCSQAGAVEGIMRRLLPKDWQITARPQQQLVVAQSATHVKSAESLMEEFDSREGSRAAPELGRELLFLNADLRRLKELSLHPQFPGVLQFATFALHHSRPESTESSSEQTHPVTLQATADSTATRLRLAGGQDLLQFAALLLLNFGG